MTGTSQETVKNRNDPGRFFGDGVVFKAKLIGILEVGEARGDRMCQEALQDLKIAIRAAGEHKQRITINVTIDGLRLRDEKTGDSLYHHPVHKISFIAQDMTDSRAFGYIFGSPDSGHRFFGIKTDKAASQVVLAMRDLFQVVFELKKKEIELARQHIQSKTIQDHHPVTLSIKSSAHESHATFTKSQLEPSTSKYSTGKEASPESVADLVDLEQELSSIQRGITQMERITPNDPPNKHSTEDDPFGDSFTQFPTYNLLPPPESSKSRHSKPLKPPAETKSVVQNENSAVPAPSAPSFPTDSWLANLADKLENVTKETITSAPEAREPSPKLQIEEDKMFDENSSQKTPSNAAAQYADAFSDLDPLGTGKIRPYVDKKYFFQDVKNPPKKLLKELSDRDGSFSTDFSPKLSVERSDSRKSSSDANENDFRAEFPAEAEIFSPNNIGTHGISPKSKINEPTFSVKHKSDDPIIGNNKALLITDNDPFSPRMKKFDPFEDDFSKKDPFEFGFSKGNATILPDTKIGAVEETSKSSDGAMFNGPLQVSLPPENYSAYMLNKRMERQTSDASYDSIARNRPNVLKQNTVDALSGIGSMKMKPLFSKNFVKRDSNMRRLQESDSFSENETAPEPPPRPDSNSYSEPPPLPPKKQFSDIVIRPRDRALLALSREPAKYDYLGATKSAFESSEISPALPVPSRRVGRTESSYPGPQRPEKRYEDNDYLTPLPSKSDVPILMPPPQTLKNRGRRQDSSKTESQRKTPNSMETKTSSSPIPTGAISDITLSQLLTLGIDELSLRLNVPVSKLNTMTIVELTKYLSDFIERTSQKSDSLTMDSTSVPTQVAPPPPITTQPPHSMKAVKESAVFKVSFDDSNETMFTAKFDDNFGEDFEPNFDKFNESQNEAIDKYAVFREIIDKELKTDDVKKYYENDQNQENENNSSLDNSTDDVEMKPKIDTKITEAISRAKDRYAALRDIILIEDLFEKPQSKIDGQNSEYTETSLSINEPEKDFDEISSPEVNISNMDYIDDVEPTKSTATPTISQTMLGSKDDLEIDEYMHRAISNMSLDSRDHLSPLSASKSPVNKLQNASTSPIQIYQRKSPLDDIAEVAAVDEAQASTLNDISTSPLPLNEKSPISKSPIDKSPQSILKPSTPLLQSALKSPISASEKPKEFDDSINANSSSENWAVFETEKPKTKDLPRNAKDIKSADSPCSSDEKADWKGEQEYKKKWTRGQTSSSSRDLSPWDDDGPDYRRRTGPPHPDRHGFYMRHARRMNSCDDDYEYEEEMAKRRERRAANKAVNRSREFIDSEPPNWYHPTNHRNWSPVDDDDDRTRSFERAAYERSTYGPPYEKRDPKSLSYSSDRYSYRSAHDKRRYRDYGRPYDMEEYDEYEVRGKARKEYGEMYESSPAFGSSRHKPSPKDYYYDKRSFDRESLESCDSAGRRGRSFGSGEMYGSLDSRGRSDYKDRFTSTDRKRSLRKMKKTQRSNEEEYDPDSDGDAAIRHVPVDSRSLQRSAGRPRKSSGSSPWDGEDLTPTTSQKTWKRPASATESEKKLSESRRAASGVLSGSDGEKDKRYHRKPRSREKDPARYGHPRYSSATRGEECEYEPGEYEDDEHYRDTHRRERRRYDSDKNMESMHRISRSNRDVYYQSEKDRYAKLDSFEPIARSRPGSRRDRDRERDREFNYDAYEDTPHPNVVTGSNKFNFENTDQGFESDFNTVPEKNLRFSNEFAASENDSNRVSNVDNRSQSIASGSEYTSTPPQHKLRFDDKITVSKFDLFEDDDFSKAEFAFENEDQWIGELPKKINLKNVNSNLKRPQDNIRKSDSVNIFAKKQDDPFADDDFFNKSSPDQNVNNGKRNGVHNSSNIQKNSTITSAPPTIPTTNNNNFQWDNNFAKFDDNI